MAQSDEFDLRDLLGDNDDGVPAIPVITDTPASELTEVESSLKSVQCHRCACFMVAVFAEKRVCRHHLDHPNDPTCGDCDRRKLINSSAYLNSANAKPEKLSHPVAPNVTAEEGVISIVPVVKDMDLEPQPGEKMSELDREYYECYNATIKEVKDLEPEELQKLRHKHLTMIRRAKIINQAIRIVMEGKLQLVDAKRRREIQDKDADFMKSRGSQKIGTVAGTEKKASSSKSTGMSAAEKQIKQFCKLNMPEQAIIDTLKAVGTGVPENVKELIAKHRSK